MAQEGQPPRRRARRLTYTAIGLAAATGLVAAVFLLVSHTPPVRRAVLRYVLTTVQRQYGLRLEADRLDYNLAALSVGLSELRVSAAGSDIPFFEARYVDVRLPSRALLGDVAFRSITVTDGRLRIVRAADGTSNLPPSSPPGTGEPPPLRIADLSIPRLAIDIQDAEHDLALMLPAALVRLRPQAGRVALLAAAEVRIGDTRTRIAELDSEATFDGRTLTFERLQVKSDEASLRIDGRLTPIAREPDLDIVFIGAGDVARLARWGMTAADMPQGQLAFRGRVWGPTADITADVYSQTQRLTWRGLTATDVNLTTRINASAVQINRAEFLVAGGMVSGAAAIPFDTAQTGGFRATWQGIDAASLVAALSPGTTPLPAGQASGQIEAEGSFSDVTRVTADASVRIQSARAGPGQLAVPGQAVLRLDEGRWRLTADHRLGNAICVTLVLGGDLNADSLAESTVSGTIRSAPTNIPVVVRVLRAAGLVEIPAEDVPTGTLEADVQVSGRLSDPTLRGQAVGRKLSGRQFVVDEAGITLAGRPRQSELTFAIAADAASVAGQPLSGVRSEGRLSGRRLTIDRLVVAQPGGTGQVFAAATYDLRTEQYDADVRVSTWEVTPATGQPAMGRVDASFSGSGTLTRPQGEAQIAIREAAWEDVAIGGIEAEIWLDGQTAAFDARLPDLHATADGRVAVDPPYMTSVAVRGDTVDLAPVLRGIEMPTPINGTVSFEASGEGPLDAWRTGRATLTVTSFDASAGELPVRLTQPARLTYADERVRIDRVEAAAGETNVSAAGVLPVRPPTVIRPDEGVVVAIAGDVGEAIRAVRAAGFTNVPATAARGPVTLLARVTGSLEVPTLAADLELGPAVVTVNQLPQVTDLRLRAHLEDDWLELREATAMYQGAVATATGRAPMSLLRATGDQPRDGASSLQAHVKGLSPAALEGIVDPTTIEQLEGTLDVSVNLASPSLDVDAVTGEVTFERLDVRIADLPVTQRTPTRVAVQGGFARVESWDWAGQGATLGVRGQVRLRDRQSALLVNGQLDLRMLTPFVRDAGITTAGRMEPRLSITGAIENPRIDGDVTVQDGQMRMVDPRIIVSDLTARAVLTRTTARVASLSGSVNGGALTGGGQVDYGPGTAMTADLTADLRGMALEFPAGLRSEVNAVLRLFLTGATPEQPLADLVGPAEQASASGRLAGTVTVVRGAYREPLAVVAGLLTNLRGRQLAAEAPSSLTAPDRSPFLDRLALDVRILTDEDLIVDNNYARAQLGGDLRVIGTAAAPALSGRAELREGGQLFVGRNVYTINSGIIDFANPIAIDPELNVEATTRAGGEDIVVRLTGTAATLEPELSSPSDPSLGQADLTSLLLTGRPLGELEPDDAAFIGAQVIGNLSGEVLGFAGRAIGLDSVRLGGVSDASRRDPTAIATEIDPTSRLTFNKSLRSDIEVTFSQSLRKSDAQTWIVDYLPSRQIQLRLVSDDEDLRSYLFRHDVAFGGGSARRQPADAERIPPLVRVAAVIVRGELALPEDRVRGVLRLEAGDRFDFAEWQADRDRLEQFYWQQGRLAARVGATRADTAEGVVLTYDVAAGPQTTVVVSGADLSRAVLARLERAWAQSVFDDFLVDEAVQIVKGALADDGYLRAMVTARLVSEGDSRRLEVAVDRGVRTVTTIVRIEGPDATRITELERLLDARGVTPRAATDPAAVEREIGGYLRERGFLRARVTVGAPLFEERTAIVPVTIDTGPSFVLAEVTFEGVRDVSVDEVRSAAGLTEGTPYEAAAAEAARDRVVTFLRREGFASATADLRATVRDEVAELTISITSGPRQSVGEVAVTANRAIDADVITRAFRLAPGDPLRADDLLRGRTRVFDTGLFRRVDVTTEPLETSKTVDGRLPMRVRVAVEEWPALRARYGFQIAEERPEGQIEGRDLVPGLSADITRRTVFGRAVTVGGAAEYQRRERRGRAFMTAPTLMGLPVFSSLVLERAHEEFADATLVTDRSAVSWEQRGRIGRDVTVSYAYKFERDHTFDTQPSLDPNFPSFDITLNIARLTGAVARDTRDDAADTVHGSLLSSSLEYAPKALGSEIRFVRYVAQSYFFRPWRNVVFASAARLGLVRPLGEQELIPSERFFAGGARTVRGVEEDSLGGRDFLGDPVGGRALLVLNQEVRVPIYRWVRGVGFIDAGNVFPTVRALGLTDLAGSVGFGLRLATPIGTVRADYGRRVWPGPAERSGRWVFGLGQAF